MNSPACPKNTHFHVVLMGVDQDVPESRVIVTERPHDALSIVISSLPVNWIGGIEVMDDDFNTPDSMPLIDYWHQTTQVV